MGKYHDIARGFTKREKALVDSLWQQLAESLNSAGPPIKDVNGWKKIWTDWKSEVKKKLAQNKIVARATGGGSFSKYTLNQTEETIVRICGMAQSVGGVSGLSFGLEDEYLISSDDDIPLTSAKRPRLDTSIAQNPTPKETTNERLKKFLEYDKEWKLDISNKMDAILEFPKIGRETDKVLVSAVNNLTQEFKKFSKKMLEVLRKHEEEEYDPLEEYG
ncbi:uncharacterized protein LOC120782061 [Bactrocera tryoni]|uniref:uncharacterized protein LOC120782061 n=1 Tax=Bactrocera tryoni TaxID=59916 RepID=UPI001A95E5D5|nr:uncharacterized protein LOC120782061 [Bactrocera tryoni]